MRDGDDRGREGRDRAFARRLGEQFAPEPLDGPGRARFDARLRERIARDGRRPLLAAGRALPLAGAAIGVALLAWGLSSGFGASPAPGDPQLALQPAPGDPQLALQPAPGDPQPTLEESAWQESAWEWDVLLGGDLGPAGRAAAEPLPEEYAAIASYFLDEDIPW